MPRAQTIALDSIVLSAMKPAASDREMIKCFIAVLLGSKPYLPFRNRLVLRAGTASPGPRGLAPASSRAWFVDRASSSPADWAVRFKVRLLPDRTRAFAPSCWQLPQASAHD